ncbi:MAG: glycerophosphodiester phosphodiesterase [Actinomycetota bacterium]
MNVLAIAHRGDPIAERENTLAAFAAAVDAGADMIELDVQCTSDGDAVVIHDATLDRIWGVPRRVVEMRADEVRALGIPDLAHVLRAIPESVQVMVDYEERAAAEPALDAVIAADVLERCLFSGDCYDGHRAIRERTPEARIASTWTHDAPAADALLDELGAEYWNPSGDILARRPEEIERMHARGSLVSVWTIDRRRHMQHFLELGVDALITNRIAVLVELLERVC